MSTWTRRPTGAARWRTVVAKAVKPGDNRSSSPHLAYNCDMSQITLVLPFALPVPEFAPDLLRALKAPALAALLTRTSNQARSVHDESARALPHELWLADALGLGGGEEPAFAGAVMRGMGLESEPGRWFIINPAHIEIARSHLLMSDLRRLQLPEDEGRALFDSAAPYFAETGHALRYGDAKTWFMRADEWSELATATPDAAAGMSLTDWMPSGARALAYRKLHNEVQVQWYTDPVNAAREARGQPAINAFWPWAGSPVASPETVVPAQGLGAPAAAPFGVARPARSNTPTVATFETPSWLSALAHRKLTTLAEIAAGTAENTLLICGNVAEPAIAADWGGWLQQMQRLETELFAPLLDSLKQGRVSKLRLVLSHRTALADFTTTAMAQRKFWRRPTLERLI
jgi:hypothetical protein